MVLLLFCIYFWFLDLKKKNLILPLEGYKYAMKLLK